MMKFHWGSPTYHTKVRAWTGSICPKVDDGDYFNRFSDYEIVKWYGVSFGVSGFLGFFKFGDNTYPAEKGPLPYSEK